MGEMTVENESRYRVVRQGFWYRVAIGIGTRTVGKFWSLLGACALADELRCAYYDGHFAANQENLREWSRLAAGVVRGEGK